MSASIWRLLAVVIIASILTPGCASKVYNHPALTTSGTPTAELTVIRKKAFGGGAVPLTVSLDGEKLVRLWIGSYAVMRVAPNTYSLTFDNASGGATAEVKLTLPSGDVSTSAPSETTLAWGVVLINDEEATWLMERYTEIRGH